MDRIYRNFPGQRERETIVFILKKHWSFILPELIKGSIPLLLGLVLPAFPVVSGYVFDTLVFSLLYIAWMVFWASYIVYAYRNWQNDRLIVTDQRIIEIDQQGAFSKRVSEIDLDKVTEIHHQIDGLIHTMFNVGTLYIHAGSHQAGIVTEGIPDPADAQESMLRLIGDMASDKPLTAQDLVSYIHNLKAEK
jgi:hypothetical protein